MSTAYRLAQGVSLNQIEGKAVLFSIKTGDSYGLNDSAAALVKALVEVGPDAAAERCAALFEVDRAQIAGDLAELTQELLGLGLLARA